MWYRFNNMWYRELYVMWKMMWFKSQSGLKKFKLADPIIHKDLFILAEKEVKKIELKDKQIGEYYKLLKLYDRASILNDII